MDERTNKGEQRRLNFLDANVVTKLSITPDQIPTMVPDQIMSQWLEGDESPYYKLQMIEYPIRANGLIYEESFFESFLSKLNERPIPGSKTGHEMWSGVRPPTDFILVGGKLESSGNGTGKVYFKNYIPKQAATDNTAFIRENQSDMVHYSLVTYPEENWTFDDEGNTEIHIVKSMFGERNDAVEWGTGAMKQVTNTGEPGEKEERGEAMDKQELLKRINTMAANGEVKLSEVAEVLGIEVLTPEVKKTMNALKELKVEDPVKEITDLRKKVEEGETAKRENVLTEAFGPKKNADGTANLVREYAERFNEVDLEKIKEDPIMKHLMAQRADYRQNAIGVVDGGQVPDDDNTSTTHRVDRV